MLTPNGKAAVRKQAEDLAELRRIALSVLRSPEAWHAEAGDIWAGDVRVCTVEPHLADYLVELHNSAPDLFSAVGR